MQNREMNKRLIVLVLSFATIICFGYALGGVGAYVMGKEKPLVIAGGLIGGGFCLLLALKLWRQFLEETEKEAQAGQQREGEEKKDLCE